MTLESSNYRHDDAIRKGSALGARPINLADVGREAYQAGELNAQQLLDYANGFSEQGILVMRCMERLNEEGQRWLSKQT